MPFRVNEWLNEVYIAGWYQWACERYWRDFEFTGRLNHLNVMNIPLLIYKLAARLDDFPNLCSQLIYQQSWVREWMYIPLAADYSAKRLCNSPASNISNMMSEPPKNSPFTYNCGMVGQLANSLIP